MSTPLDRLFKPIQQDVTRTELPIAGGKDIGWRDFVRQFLPEAVQQFVPTTEEVKETEERKARGITEGLPLGQQYLKEYNPSLYERTVPANIRQALRSRPDAPERTESAPETLAKLVGLNDPLSNIEGPAKAATVLSRVEDVAHPLASSVVKKSYNRIHTSPGMMKDYKRYIKELEEDIEGTKDYIAYLREEKRVIEGTSNVPPHLQDIVKNLKSKGGKTLETINTEIRDAENRLNKWSKEVSDFRDTSPVTVYHGTGSAFESFDPEKLDPNALYGPGYYFTENPEIASGYTQKVGDPSPEIKKEIDRITEDRDALISRDNVLRARKHEIRKEVDPNNPNTAIIPRGHPKEAEYEELRKQVDLNQDEYNRLTDQIDILNASASAPNIRPARLAAQNPFDIEKVYKIEDLPESIKKYIEPNSFTRQHGIKGSEIYDALKRGYQPKNITESLSVNIRNDLNGRKIFARQVLEKAGFDAITHIGGARTGNDPHRVWIIFDKNKIYSPFGPANKAKVVGFNEPEQKKETPLDKLFSSPVSNA